MKLMGVIVRRRVLGKHLAFCHVQPSVLEKESKPEDGFGEELPTGQEQGDGGGDGEDIVRVAFRRSSDAWDTTRDETFPTKVSRLPYGATVFMELKESSPTAKQEQQQAYDWEVCSWRILVHPNVLAQSKSALVGADNNKNSNDIQNQSKVDMNAIVSVPAYLRARGEMFMQLHPEKRPKKVKRVIQHPFTSMNTEANNPHGGGDAQAKCQRATVFCNWLLETFGLERLHSTIVLDVAAGKGQLSIELACSPAAVRCIMVDPMIRGQRHDPNSNNITTNTNTTTSRTSATTSSAATTTTITAPIVDDINNDDSSSFQILGKRARKRIQKAGGPLPVFLPAYFNATRFVEKHAHGNGVLSNCTLLVGLHPDQCTEAIIDVALSLQKSFAVVPCCVFGDLFAIRRLRQTGDYVRTYDQFLQYLREKDARIQQATLPVCGKNQVLYLFQ